jgi:hypothetical protein
MTGSITSNSPKCPEQPHDGDENLGKDSKPVIEDMGEDLGEDAPTSMHDTMGTGTPEIQTFFFDNVPNQSSNSTEREQQEQEDNTQSDSIESSDDESTDNDKSSVDSTPHQDSYSTPNGTPRRNNHHNSEPELDKVKTWNINREKHALTKPPIRKKE